MTPEEAVAAWRRFAESLTFEFRGERTNWRNHISGKRYIDEEQLVQPLAFPRFAEELLGFKVGENLAAELSGEEGKPDFTPADAVTHDFVFETKSTSAGVSLHGYDEQVTRYLELGRHRIKHVILTNLVGLRVFTLSATGTLHEAYGVNLLGLLSGETSIHVGTPAAENLARFLDQFGFRELTVAEKIYRIRHAPPWNPVLETTNPNWVSSRLDAVVEVLRRDVTDRVAAGALTSADVRHHERAGIVLELRELEYRLGGDPEEASRRELAAYLAAADGTTAALARRQYIAHVAYYAATRLMLVRVWEDLNLLPQMLHDGGFDDWMHRASEVIRRVVEFSFLEAKDHYPSLFTGSNNFTWFTPSEDSYVEVLYQLSNTYFGEIQTDVLGDVYQRLLERVDRKQVGQFYTPRDIIRLIWDLIDLEAVADPAAEEGRELRVLDIATGSGGFLVEAARRMRASMEAAASAGAGVDRLQFIREAAEGLVGIELQRFPAYLAELNLLIQLGLSLTKTLSEAVPPLSILCQDTMSLHNPDGPKGPEPSTDFLDRDRQHKLDMIRRAAEHECWFDVACGNPPYVGEKRAAAVLRRTRQQFPYWEQFVAPHLDVLYWFLILGISKLRQGGRFGFITTEYWLRADGAGPLRQYLAQRCRIDHIVLFRRMRLFPDAPGQHSMIITGERVVAPDPELAAELGPAVDYKPRVTIYEGLHVGDDERSEVLNRIKSSTSRSGVRAFTSSVCPNVLVRESWAEVSLTQAQLRRRRRLRRLAEPLELEIEEGVIATPDKLKAATASELPHSTLAALKWPDERAGIFVLSPEEVRELEPNRAETEVLRPVINTRDVYPYAVVLPEDARRMVYLESPKPSGLTVDQLQSQPFPPGMPNLQRHIERFEPILRKKVRQWRSGAPGGRCTVLGLT